MTKNIVGGRNMKSDMIYRSRYKDTYLSLYRAGFKQLVHHFLRGLEVIPGRVRVRGTAAQGSNAHHIPEGIEQTRVEKEWTVMS